MAAQSAHVMLQGTLSSSSCQIYGTARKQKGRNSDVTIAQQPHIIGDKPSCTRPVPSGTSTHGFVLLAGVAGTSSAHSRRLFQNRR